jgi:dual specificity phosphatase 3
MTDQTSTQPLPVFHVANAHFVTPFLAVGGDLSYDDAVAVRQSVELVDGGVTRILDVRQEADDSDWWASVEGVDYLWAGIDDAGQRLPAAWFDHIAGWATEAISAGGVVLTHCHMGINRGPSAGYAVLLALGWDPVDALAAIRAARPIATSGTPRTPSPGTWTGSEQAPASAVRRTPGWRGGGRRTPSTWSASFAGSGSRKPVDSDPARTIPASTTTKGEAR